MNRAVAAIPATLGLGALIAPSSTDTEPRARANVPRTEIEAAAVAGRVAAPVVGQTPYGDPKPDEPADWTLLERRGFRLAYDEDRLNPAWVSYSYEFRPNLHTGHTRVSRFSLDESTRARITHDHYTKSGYSRGHMAPSFGIFTYFGKEAQRETYLMSNVVPQEQAMNAGPWEEAEDRSANSFAQLCGTIWTIDGPVYPTSPETISARKVHVPSETFKIILRYDGASAQPQLLAFMMPQKAKQKDPAVKYLVSVDEIEEKSGLDFFPDLPDDLEEGIEKVRATKLWR